MKFTFFVSLLLLSACASAPSASVKTGSADSLPLWVNQPQGSYPENRYLVAVGNGRDRNSAIDDAKKQMAESFVVKVKSELQNKSQSTLNQDTGGGASGDASEKTAKDLSLSTETSLRGAEVKQVTQVGSEFYSLVALDKLKARSGLLLEANRIKTKLDSSLDALETNFTNEKLTESKVELANLEQLYGEASALGMSALVDVNPSQMRLNRLENGARTKTARMIFAVKTVKGETYFERDIQSCISDRGGSVYTFDQAPKGANKIQITVVERPQHLPIEGWTKIRFDLTAAVVQDDGKLFRVQTTQTETGRSRDAVLESVSDKLSHDFCEGLFNRMNEAR
jgi:hypothetical protein